MAAYPDPLSDSSLPDLSLPPFADPPSAPASRWSNFNFLSYVLGALTTLVIGGGSQLLLTQSDPPPIEIHAPPPPTATVTPVPVPPTATPAPITVYVTGGVRKPDLYLLPPDARVGDAIQAAGGFTATVDPAVLNLAQKLYDGAQIYVPLPGEASAATQPPATGISGGTPPIAASDNGLAPIGKTSVGKINLNSASLAELDSLPGIGLKRAEAIIANRPYASIDDLDKLDGVGPGLIDQLRDLVTVQ